MWHFLARAADVTGLIAFALVVLGVVSTIVTRPRMTVSVYGVSTTSANVTLMYSAGSSPARNVSMGDGALNGNGVAVSGDTTMWRRDVMLPGDWLSAIIYDPEQTHFGSEPRTNEERFGVPQPLGAIADFSWQHPLVPWLRVRWVILWSQAARAAGTAPVLLKGRRAASAYRKAMTPPA